MKQFDLWKAGEKEKILLKRCYETIKRIDPSAQVILYGSRARGDASFDSDYDLLVLVDGDVNLEKEDILCQRLFPIQLEEDCLLTVNVYNQREWNSPLYQAMPFHQNVERDGVVL